MFSSMKFNIESVWSIFIFLNYVDMCWRTLISGLNSQGLVNTGPMDSSLTSISTRHSPQKSIKLLLIRMRMHAKEDKKWRQDMVSFSLCLLVFLPFFFHSFRSASLSGPICHRVWSAWAMRVVSGFRSFQGSGWSPQSRDSGTHSFQEDFWELSTCWLPGKGRKSTKGLV